MLQAPLQEPFEPIWVKEYFARSPPMVLTLFVPSTETIYRFLELLIGSVVPSRFEGSQQHADSNAESKHISYQVGPYRWKIRLNSNQWQLMNQLSQ